MSEIQVGAENPIISDLLKNLVTDGSSVLQAELAVALPWSALPVINFFVGLICTWVCNFIITNLDQAGFAIYVSIKTGRQVSEYFKAKQTGVQGDIDKTGDSLIHLGNE